MIVPVVLAGGAGTGLWPLSRERHPKQLLAFRGDETLLAATVARLASLPDVAPPVVVCHDELRFLVAEQVRGRDARVLLEPVPRGTAAAVAAALAAVEGDPLVLFVPSDLAFDRPEGLAGAVTGARALAERGDVVLFAVPATSASTAYGWISGGRLVEKPSADVAERLLADGAAVNAGLVLARASVLRGAVAREAPDVARAAVAAVSSAKHDLDFVRLGAAFAEAPAASLERAVLERLDVAVVGLDAGWRDLGTWAAFGDPGDGNDLSGDVVVEDARGCTVAATSRLVAVVGAEDLVVVETPDAVLVVRRDRTEAVGRVVARLQAAGREEAVVHRRVARPWGAYTVVDRGGRYQVKRIVVEPGHGLSLQEHRHRAEHWIVIKGTARITRGSEVFLVREDASAFIPVGVRHRLENPGDVPLEMIEVQTGDYLGEDDIVRYDDRYGR